jgi:hypothetical protein
MKRSTAIAVSVSLVLLLVLLISVLALASVPGFELATKIPAGEHFTHSVIALAGDNITVSWESSGHLGFALIDPDGFVTFGTGSDSYSRTFDVYRSGVWTLYWGNHGDSSVKLSFDASSSTIDSIRDPLLTEVAWLVAIIVVLIILLIAVIVFVTRYSRHLGMDQSKGRGET